MEAEARASALGGRVSELEAARAADPGLRFDDEANGSPREKNAATEDQAQGRLFREKVPVGGGGGGGGGCSDGCAHTALRGGV